MRQAGRNGVPADRARGDFSGHGTRRCPPPLLAQAGIESVGQSCLVACTRGPHPGPPRCGREGAGFSISSEHAPSLPQRGRAGWGPLATASGSEREVPTSLSSLPGRASGSSGSPPETDEPHRNTAIISARIREAARRSSRRRRSTSDYPPGSRSYLGSRGRT